MNYENLIQEIADQTAYLRVAKGLTVPNAVWTTLRTRGFANSAEASKIAKDVLRVLQIRSVARRRKNKKQGIRSQRIPGQMDFKELFREMSETAKQRGGDPAD